MRSRIIGSESLYRRSSRLFTKWLPGFDENPDHVLAIPQQSQKAILVGALLFLAVWAILHVPPFNANQILDTPIYQRYGGNVLAGLVPYRDFDLEYPPGALLAFIIPSFAPKAHYRRAFELLMLACGLGTVALVGLSLSRLGATKWRLYVGTALPAIATGLLGSVALTRFDYWPALLTAGAVTGVLARRELLGFAALGVAISAKIYPAVLLPILFIEVWRTQNPHRALGALSVCAAVVALSFVPFAILAPHGLGGTLSQQAGRPLQIESVGAAILLAAHQIGIYDPIVLQTHGSHNLSGSAPDTIAALSTAVQIMVVVGAWVLFASGRGARGNILAACALPVAAFIASGKVLSPQYMIWLVPLIPLLAGRTGRVAVVVFLGCCAVTQLWFPQLYRHLINLEPFPTALLIVRDALLIILVGVLWIATASSRARPGEEGAVA
jgi:hypothetical protein